MEKIKIAYLGPEIPAVSATFISNEIIELEKMGFDIDVYSVHQPASLADDLKDVSPFSSTCYVYSHKSLFPLAFLKNIFSFRMKLGKGLSLLASDISVKGWGSKQTIKLIYQFFAANYLAMKLTRRNVEYLHIHFGHVPTQIGMYCSAISDIPFSFTTHANDIYQQGFLLKEKADRAVTCVTISDFNQRYLSSLGIGDKKIQVIHCGVQEREEKRTSHIIEGTLRLGCLGRFVEKKGIDTLLEALVIIKEKGIDAILDLAGYGPLKEKFRSFVREHGLEENVNFLGQMKHEDVFSWLESLDMFVLPCKIASNGDVDGIPVVLMEAMSWGVPVISSGVSGIGELINDRTNGLIAEPDNPEMLGDLIIELLSNTELYHIIVENGYRTINKDFSLRNNAEQISRIIRRAINE